uniref:Uncharacterized protein n=1 Tax=Panagrolaimus sp. ES5 TaxID=591445 RepID=A0AC34GWP1_9BILA
MVVISQDTGTSSSVKKSNLKSDKPDQSSQAEQPTPKKEQSKSKSKLLDAKQKKSLNKEPSKVHVEGKTDPFEAADGDDEEGGGGGTGKDRTETSQKCQSKSKKRGGKGKLGLPNKDGYDDLNPNKNGDEDAKSKMKTEETKSKMQQKDDGYDAIDPTKNVNLENVNMNDDKAASPVGKPNKPRQIPRDAKQQQIAKGAKKGKGDYPTMDDVISDWDSKKESVGAPAAAGVGEKSKVKPSPGKKSATITEENSDKEEKFQLKSRDVAKTERTQP